jgi:hypothetical protein
MNQPRQSSSPGFYKAMAILFFVLGAVFVWAAVSRHSGYFWWIAIITVLNGLMSTLKFMAARET